MLPTVSTQQLGIPQGESKGLEESAELVLSWGWSSLVPSLLWRIPRAAKPPTASQSQAGFARVSPMPRLWF